jgi:hypothetical protein
VTAALKEPQKLNTGPHVYTPRAAFERSKTVYALDTPAADIRLGVPSARGYMLQDQLSDMWDYNAIKWQLAILLLRVLNIPLYPASGCDEATIPSE